MQKRLWLAAIAGLVSGCVSYESAYERAVYDHEPVYCYQSLADVICGRQPSGRDERRLVSYYGPAPGKYEPPPLPRPAKAAAPPRIKAYYRDPEPPAGPPQQPAAAAASAPAMAAAPPPGASAAPASATPASATPKSAPPASVLPDTRGPLHLGPAATAGPWSLP
jgi:hypothetical protein